jgi:hypothetical protein
VTPEEAATHLQEDLQQAKRDHRQPRFRALDSMFCDCSTRRRVLSAVYADQEGRRLLWVTADRQQSADRLIPLDSEQIRGRTHAEKTSCPRCNQGLVLLVRDGQISAIEVGFPTHGIVTN